MESLTQPSLITRKVGLCFLSAGKGGGKYVAGIFIPIKIFWSIFVLSNLNFLDEEWASVGLEAEPRGPPRCLTSFVISKANL